MFSGKSVVLGVTGGIAAYKACEIARALTHRGVGVHVIMTRAAQHFVCPLTFQTLTGNRVHTDLFDLGQESEIDHISLARRGRVIVVAPATANFIGKVASGVADDLLTTVVCASQVPVLVAPAMNVAMWHNPIVQGNVRKLSELGYSFVAPQAGELACGEEGEGKLADVDIILEHTQAYLADKLFLGKKIVIDAGPTHEHLDPVRYISNRSSGKMGYALARVAHWMGAESVLVSGPTSLPDPVGVRMIRVTSASEMLAAVREELAGADVLIGAAAVADFAPSEYRERKMKKGEMSRTWKLVEAPDILAETIPQREGIFTVGFAAETHNLMAYAEEKIRDKKLDIICANDVSDPDIGFDSEENELMILTAGGQKKGIPRKPKDEVAKQVLEFVAGKMGLLKKVTKAS